MGCGCGKLNSHKKKDKPDIKPFDEGNQRNYYENENPPPKKKTKKFQGDGIIIGTKEEQTNGNNGDKRQKILEAAEKRMLAEQNRGVKKENQFAYELQKKKLEDAKKYENEQYILNWK